MCNGDMEFYTTVWSLSSRKRQNEKQKLDNRGGKMAD